MSAFEIASCINIDASVTSVTLSNIQVTQIIPINFGSAANTAVSALTVPSLIQSGITVGNIGETTVRTGSVTALDINTGTTFPVRVPLNFLYKADDDLVANNGVVHFRIKNGFTSFQCSIVDLTGGIYGNNVNIDLINNIALAYTYGTGTTAPTDSVGDVSGSGTKATSSAFIFNTTLETGYTHIFINNKNGYSSIYTSSFWGLGNLYLQFSSSIISVPVSLSVIPGWNLIGSSIDVNITNMTSIKYLYGFSGGSFILKTSSNLTPGGYWLFWDNGSPGTIPTDKKIGYLVSIYVTPGWNLIAISVNTTIDRTNIKYLYCFSGGSFILITSSQLTPGGYWLFWDSGVGNIPITIS